MDLLQGKVAIITGAASGIGRATAELFLKHGAVVALVDKDASGLETLKRSVQADRVAVCTADVSDPADSDRYVAAAVRQFGGIDVAVFNVGIPGELKPIAESSVETFDRVMAVNVRGTWLGLHYAIPHMARRGGGSIVLTASTAGFRAGAPGRCAYVTSKHAVVGLMRSAAAECASLGIRVNSVSPGGVDTPMTRSLKDIVGPEKAAELIRAFELTIPLKRIASPEEIAEAILFFAGDQSRYCTGTNLMVDGGLMG
jgi:meso-butanediol dehydrogenase/(S,S)-butanediol dehydrogenase/diacetyl reductase